MSAGPPRYEEDFYRWPQKQAALLRAGKWHALDCEHLSEEIEALGRSVRVALSARLSHPQSAGFDRGKPRSIPDCLAESPGPRPQLPTLCWAIWSRRQRSVFSVSRTSALSWRIFASAQVAPSGVAADGAPAHAGECYHYLGLPAPAETLALFPDGARRTRA